jgi:hypothetical protein
LEQGFAEVCITGQKCPTAPKGLPKGATEHGHGPVGKGMAEATPTIAQDAQGMGFIDEEFGSMARAKLCHGTQVGTGALHAEQAFCDHQRLVTWLPIPAALQLLVQIDEVVVGKALKPRTTGLHSCE